MTLEQEELEKSAHLARYELGSINLDDIEKLDGVELSDEEYMARAGDAETFHSNHFDKVLTLLINKQLKFIAERATSDLTLQFARGTINGLWLVQEWFKEQINLSKSKFDDNVNTKNR